MATYRILCFDGGGTRGLFTTRLLERLLAKKRSLIRKTDLVAGTSTGGIIALGLAAGKRPRRMGQLYRRHGKDIFDDSLWDNLLNLGNAVGADYGHRGLERVLNREFGDLTLGDLDKRVLIPAFDLDARPKQGRPRTWKPKFFHNFPGRDSDREQRVTNVAIRTSSAPTYFPAYQGYIDGGVVANNPSMAALAQAVHEGEDLSDIALLSLGTGDEARHLSGSPDWGWAQWARPLVSLMINGVMGVADYQCRSLLQDRYFRLNTYLSRSVELDDVRKKTLDYLVQTANEVDLDPVLDWLADVGW